jgi:mRNA interferase MazF
MILMTMASNIVPKRGEVWRVNFDPQVGSEIQKIRPAVVISVVSPYSAHLSIVVPITSWQAKHASYFWMVNIAAAPTNGLTNNSGANALQIKSVSVQRFERKIGVLTAAEIEDIAAAVVLSIGYTP